MASIIARTGDKLLDGADADLWWQLQLAAPNIVPTWIPSHQTLDQILPLGYTKLQWEGNVKADQAATASLHFRRPSHQIVKERISALSDLRQAQLVAVAVHEAHLQQQYPHSAPKTKRRRRRRFAFTLRSLPTIMIHRA